MELGTLFSLLMKWVPWAFLITVFICVLVVLVFVWIDNWLTGDF
ncbi:MAG: hypothetical protein G01um101470_1008, partial [Parcubacteria group bacterium Gr01-1014_70]